MDRNSDEFRERKRMMYPIYDQDGVQIAEAPGRDVRCDNAGCENYDIPIEVADHPSVAVLCGPCGLWIVEPSPDGSQPAPE